MASKSQRIMDAIFESHFDAATNTITFTYENVNEACELIGEVPPKNIWGMIYQYRNKPESLPPKWTEALRPGHEWVIGGDAKTKYFARQAPESVIYPNPDLPIIEVPDARPAVVTKMGFKDEQALLATVRDCQLINLFTGCIAYSIQNHLRTGVNGKQVEIDEIYTCYDANAKRFIVPVQAKVGKQRVDRYQLEADLEYCKARHPDFEPLCISVQEFEGVIHMYELEINDETDAIVVQNELKVKIVGA